MKKIEEYLDQCKLSLFTEASFDYEGLKDTFLVDLTSYAQGINKECSFASLLSKCEELQKKCEKEQTLAKRMVSLPSSAKLEEGFDILETASKLLLSVTSKSFATKLEAEKKYEKCKDDIDACVQDLIEVFSKKEEMSVAMMCKEFREILPITSAILSDKYKGVLNALDTIEESYDNMEEEYETLREGEDLTDVEKAALVEAIHGHTNCCRAYISFVKAFYGKYYHMYAQHIHTLTK